MNADNDWEYTAYEKWPYEQLIFYFEGQEKSWISMEQSFFWASKHLVDQVVRGTLREDVEGVAAVYMFRHFLELVLKDMVFAGRLLTEEGDLVPYEEVEKVANIHDLGTLWSWVLSDAKPKIEKDWDNFDWNFAGQCIAEFDAADKKGFAFRYKGHGGERAHVSMDRLAATMEHVYQVLDGILTLLIETRGEIEDWLSELRSQAGW